MKCCRQQGQTEQSTGKLDKPHKNSLSLFNAGPDLPRKQSPKRRTGMRLLTTEPAIQLAERRKKGPAVADPEPVCRAPVDCQMAVTAAA